MAFITALHAVRKRGHGGLISGIKWGNMLPFISPPQLFPCHRTFISDLPDALFLLFTLAHPIPYSRVRQTPLLWISDSFLHSGNSCPLGRRPQNPPFIMRS